MLSSWLKIVLVFGLCLLIICFTWADGIKEYFHLRSLTPMLVTVLTTLVSLLIPPYLGLIQARGNFSLLGWLRISVDALILIGVVGAISVASPDAMGGISGLGVGLFLSLALLRSIHLYIGRSSAARAPMSKILRQCLPLTLGFGIPAFMLS
jgi:O-antigen/teichoic acid export membrane protein